jgi:hypothetical protein
MFRIVAHAALFAGALALGACGFADSRAPVPEFMRMKEAEQPPPEPPPDVRKLVREQLDVVFMATSYPREVEVAPPHHEVRGLGWTSCVRAQLTSATGTALGDLHRDDQCWKGRRPSPCRGRRHLRVRIISADLKHDPEKCEAVFRKDHAQKKNLKRDDDSSRSHRALGNISTARRHRVPENMQAFPGKTCSAAGTNVVSHSCPAEGSCDGGD